MVLVMAISRASTVTVPRNITGEDNSVSRLCELDINIGIAMDGSAAWTMTALSSAVGTVAKVTGKAAVVITVPAGDIREC